MVKMKTLMLLVAIGAVAVMLSSAPANEKNPSAQSDRAFQQLEATVKRLENKVNAMERRITELEDQLRPRPRFLPRPPQLKEHLLPKLPETKQRPKIWGRDEVNGWEFYYIPLKE